MAKVLLENTREHDLTISTSVKGVVTHATIPGARQNPNNRNELVNGIAEVDSELIDAAKKASPVVAGWFEDGALKQATKKAIADQAKLEVKE